MTTQPQKEYIITEDQLAELYTLSQMIYSSSFFEVVKKVHSHPAPSPEHDPECLHHKVCRFDCDEGDCDHPCPHRISTYNPEQAEAAAQAREKVMDALCRDWKGRYVEDVVAEIRRFPESLRTTPQEQP